MKLPLEWLREQIPTSLTDEQIAERLTATGTAVEKVITRGIADTPGNRESFLVGKVLTCEQHPDADRLRVLSVDTGHDEPRQIVCGAPNVAAGQTVPVAIPGAVMPNGQKLGKAKLRGVESLGMVCSATELELADESDGILVLPDDLAAGTPILDALPAPGTVLELELTPNRGDCQGIYGIAREVHAITGEALPPLDDTLPVEDGPGQVGDHVSLTVEATDLCPRYMARVLVDVTVGPSPDWMVRRLEAATFDGPNNIRTSLGLGLRTESSARFEKGQPRELPPYAMALACLLLTQLAGAKLVPGVLDAHEPSPAAPVITLRHPRVGHILGADISADESATTLERLGCTVERGADAHSVTVPWHRVADLQREIDLIEEVGRIHGFDRIEAVLPRVTARARLTPEQTIVRQVARRAADLGLSEAISYRFVPEADLDRLGIPADDSVRNVIRISNALSDEMAVMRRSLLPGLLRAVARNQSHQRRDGGIFEVGRTYIPSASGLADEPEEITAVLFGAPGARGWRQQPDDVDVWSATGLGIALARAAGIEAEAAPGAERPDLHPIRQARITAHGHRIGIAGEVHPAVLQAFDVKGPVVMVTLWIADLAKQRPVEPRKYVDLISVPVSTRDLAVIVPDSVPASRVLEVVREAGGDLVRDAEVFDHYDGDQVPDGHVSLAVRAHIADPGRTLTDDEIDAVTDRAVTALREAVGAELRS